MEKLLRKFTKEEIEKLKALKGVRTFHHDYQLLKANEVPEHAALLIEGEFGVLKNNEEVLLLNPGYAIGLHEVMKNEPTKMNVKARKNAKAIILSKLDFDENSPLFAILGNLFFLS